MIKFLISFFTFGLLAGCPQLVMPVSPAEYLLYAAAELESISQASLEIAAYQEKQTDKAFQSGKITIQQAGVRYKETANWLRKMKAGVEKGKVTVEIANTALTAGDLSKVDNSILTLRNIIRDLRTDLGE